VVRRPLDQCSSSLAPPPPLVLGLLELESGIYAEHAPSTCFCRVRWRGTSTRDVRRGRPECRLHPGCTRRSVPQDDRPGIDQCVRSLRRLKKWRMLRSSSREPGHRSAYVAAMAESGVGAASASALGSSRHTVLQRLTAAGPARGLLDFNSLSRRNLKNSPWPRQQPAGGYGAPPSERIHQRGLRGGPASLGRRPTVGTATRNDDQDRVQMSSVPLSSVRARRCYDRPTAVCKKVTIARSVVRPSPTPSVAEIIATRLAPDLPEVPTSCSSMRPRTRTPTFTRGNTAARLVRPRSHSSAEANRAQTPRTTLLHHPASRQQVLR